MTIVPFFALQAVSKLYSRLDGRGQFFCRALGKLRRLTCFAAREHWLTPWRSAQTRFRSSTQQWHRYCDWVEARKWAFTRICRVVDRSDQRECQASPPAWPRPPARPRTTRRCFYDRVRTESVQMKDREGSRLARPPRRTPGNNLTLEGCSASQRCSPQLFSWSQRLTAGLGVARRSLECKILLPRRLAADRRRSTATL